MSDVVKAYFVPNGSYLMEMAEEATYAAKAAGRPVAVAGTNGKVSAPGLQ